MLLQIIEAIATALWSYAAVTGALWAAHLWQLDRSAHVAAVAELLGHLVPAMIGLVIVVLIGALVGLPSVVALIALLFPGGLAYGTHMALSEAREDTAALTLTLRIITVAVLASAIIAYRQIL